jgi:hypothetical protein
MRLPMSRPFARPFTAALQRALDRPIEGVLYDYATLQESWERAREQARSGASPLINGPKALDALATAAVARAAMGSDTLLVQIADRLEGKPAVRLDEIEDPSQRADMVSRIEAVVRAMNAPRLQPGDDARLVEGQAEVETAPDSAKSEG